MKHILFLVIIQYLVRIDGRELNALDGDWIVACGKLYMFGHSHLKFTKSEAVTYCESVGMSLISLETSREKICLQKKINSSLQLKDIKFWTSATIQWPDGTDLTEAIFDDREIALERIDYVHYSHLEKDGEEMGVCVYSDMDSMNLYITSCKRKLTYPLCEGKWNKTIKIPVCEPSCKLQIPVQSADSKSLLLGSFAVSGEACGSEYFITEEKMHQPAGEQYCTKVGMKILSAETPEKLGCISSILYDLVWDKTITNIWTSARSGGCSRKFIWCNQGRNEPVISSFFRKAETSGGLQEPNNFNFQEECVILSSFSFDLIDTPCKELYHVVCEKKSGIEENPQLSGPGADDKNKGIIVKHKLLGMKKKVVQKNTIISRKKIIMYQTQGTTNTFSSMTSSKPGNVLTIHPKIGQRKYTSSDLIKNPKFRRSTERKMYTKKTVSSSNTRKFKRSVNNNSKNSKRLKTSRQKYVGTTDSKIADSIIGGIVNKKLAFQASKIQVTSVTNLKSNLTTQKASISNLVSSQKLSSQPTTIKYQITTINVTKTTSNSLRTTMNVTLKLNEKIGQLPSSVTLAKNAIGITGFLVTKIVITQQPTSKTTLAGKYYFHFPVFDVPKKFTEIRPTVTLKQNVVTTTRSSSTLPTKIILATPTHTSVNLTSTTKQAKTQSQSTNLTSGNVAIVLKSGQDIEIQTRGVKNYEFRRIYITSFRFSLNVKQDAYLAIANARLNILCEISIGIKNQESMFICGGAIKTSVLTADILSEDMFQDFWLSCNEDGYLMFGQENDTSPLLEYTMKSLSQFANIGLKTGQDLHGYWRFPSYLFVPPVVTTTQKLSTLLKKETKSTKAIKKVKTTVATPLQQQENSFPIAGKNNKFETDVGFYTTHRNGIWITACSRLYFIGYPNLQMTRDEALDFCVSQGMKLLSFETLSEKQCLRDAVKNQTAMQGANYWTTAMLQWDNNKPLTREIMGEVDDDKDVTRKQTDDSFLISGLKQYRIELSKTFVSLRKRGPCVFIDLDTTNLWTAGCKREGILPICEAAVNSSVKIPTCEPVCPIEPESLLDYISDDIGGFNIEGCGKEYYIFETTMSQGDGAYNCTAIGKSILSIETRQELDCVAGLLEGVINH